MTEDAEAARQRLADLRRQHAQEVRDEARVDAGGRRVWPAHARSAPRQRSRHPLHQVGARPRPADSEDGAGCV